MRPAFQFYPGDWQRDIGLRACSIAARGLWIELMCLMHQGDPYGHLTINGKAVKDGAICRLVSCDAADVPPLLAELEENGVLSRTKEGAIYSRRMVKDEAARIKRAECGKMGGNPSLRGDSTQDDNPDDNPEVKVEDNHEVKVDLNHPHKVKPTPSSSSSSSSSSSVSSSSSPSSSSSSSASASKPSAFFVPPDVDREMLAIPTKGGKLFRVPDEMLANMQALYPTVDVVTEVLAMRGWAEAAADRPKPVNEMKSFISGWLKRTADKLAAAKAAGNAAPRRASDAYTRGSDLVAQRGAS